MEYATQKPENIISDIFKKKCQEFQLNPVRISIVCISKNCMQYSLNAGAENELMLLCWFFRLTLQINSILCDCL